MRKAQPVNRAEYQRNYYRTVVKAKRQQAAKPKGRCSYCGARGEVVKDHQHPKANGGTDNPRNLVDCCPQCNKSKGRRSLEEWRQTIARENDGGPYFSPTQIAYLRGKGFDLQTEIETLASSILFYFEGGDGRAVKKYVRRRVDSRA